MAPASRCWPNAPAMQPAAPATGPQPPAGIGYTAGRARAGSMCARPAMRRRCTGINSAHTHWHWRRPAHPPLQQRALRRSPDRAGPGCCYGWRWQPPPGGWSAGAAELQPPRRCRGCRPCALSSRPHCRGRVQSAGAAAHLQRCGGLQRRSAHGIRPLRGGQGRVRHAYAQRSHHAPGVTTNHGTTIRCTQLLIGNRHQPSPAHQAPTRSTPDATPGSGYWPAFPHLPPAAGLLARPAHPPRPHREYPMPRRVRATSHRSRDCCRW